VHWCTAEEVEEDATTMRTQAGRRVRISNPRPAACTLWNLSSSAQRPTAPKTGNIQGMVSGWAGKRDGGCGRQTGDGTLAQGTEMRSGDGHGGTGTGHRDWDKDGDKGGRGTLAQRAQVTGTKTGLLQGRMGVGAYRWLSQAARRTT
jgi:hypothetical protein